MEEITQDTLRQLLDYDPETGVFTWKPRTADMFTHTKLPQMQCARWNSRHAGQIAGSVDERGYVIINMQGKHIKAHRAAIMYVSGVWPVEDIDHINMNKSDNRLINLRVATRRENTMNTGIRSNNTSGIKGVHFHKGSMKWTTCVAGKYLGVFHCPAAAAFAYQIEADKRYGKFARAA